MAQKSMIGSLMEWKRLFVPLRLCWWLAERRVNRQFEDDIEKARTERDEGRLSALMHDHTFELARISDTRLAKMQQKWIRKAQKLMVPVPNQDIDKITREAEDENWMTSYAANEILLKPQAMINLRRELRREQKERRDLYMPWVTAAIGLLGAATGLVAVMLH